ncbi:MAG: hypothetical protein MOB07_19625 [Acidobacteria bacterium]|nr:hypothetical protein [Acidobacteriota bacterium]
MNDHCPMCRQQLVEYLLERGVSIACPLCWQVYHYAEYVADSPAVPIDIRQQAKDVARLAWGIGLAALAGVALAAIFDRSKRGR